jgi:hypothetical protein
MTILQTVATGSGAIDASHVAPTGQHYQLLSVALHLSAAPTTSESLTVTLNSMHGAEYDARLYTVDPSATSLTDLYWTPDADTWLAPGDAVDVHYANTDARVYGLTITVQGV